ncbi:kinesin [Lepidopterella palustris CBS 459.81]|uniref:Kinesin-like protein n=1 Tax=Lepidopterella palustris CBS 459.81 TaxID=1314670 RepID=A0A8E2EG16_9PEZI|nr:kinesin [Lepidopterella palustris CBS 459.81]
MEPPPRPSASLFDVYLRLRPSNAVGAERFLDVEQSEQNTPTHITIKPPSSDHRKRAVEKFAFTRVFEEDAVQLDIFKGTGVVPLIEGVLGAEGSEGRDGLLATLGVTGSGKSHTILGSKTQRGLTQMALDVLFQSTSTQLVRPNYSSTALPSLAAADVSEAQLFAASSFLDSIYSEPQTERGYGSRAQTPMLDCSSFLGVPSTRQRNVPRPSALPQMPSVHDVIVPADPNAEYAIVVSMYEVYNDRIFDLLTGNATNNKNGQQKRRALLFKSTEQSTDRKVVAGLRKIVCGSLEDALMVLETGLMERRVAGTGSNAVSSRSHGFFCVEVKKRDRTRIGPWTGSTLTIVDLAGSERARHAKTAGATLAEAGKINESLMYLGQCMQMQSDNQEGNKQNIVPFRQCKLTELLFSNSFPSPSTTASHHHNHHHHPHRNPQKAIMIVTADPVGDFNATSQILRYSALAREVTVPRIPSVTSTILSGTTAIGGKSQLASGRNSPSVPYEELEQATQEIARLCEEVDVLALRLAEETARRKAAEASWRAAEEHMLEVEQNVRDDCFAEMEMRIEAERRRWKGAWDEEADRNDEHLDRKIEVLVQGIQVYEDPAPSESERVEELERENEALKRKVELLEREVQCKSPVKKQRVLKAKKWEVDLGSDSP